MGKFKITKKQFETASEYKQNEQAEEESEEKKKLKETITKLDEEYKNSPDRTYGDTKIPNTVEKTYEKPTNEQTIDKADSEISPLYQAKMQSLTSESNMKQQNLEDKKDELYQRAEESLKELRKSYDSAKENTSNEALKRGLARSSIVMNLLNDLEGERINATGGILSQRDKELDSVSKQIDDLKVKLLNDTNVLNEERAKEINQRIDELVDKYNKEEKEIAEYNNKLRQQKAETIAKLKEAGVDVDETKSEEYMKMYAGKIKALYSYYYSLGEDALKEMQKDKQFITDNVGENGYDTLARYFE